MKAPLVLLALLVAYSQAPAQIGESFEKFSRLTEYKQTAPQGKKHFFHSEDNSAQITVWVDADNTIRKIMYEFDVTGAEFKDDTIQTLYTLIVSAELGKK